jgi:hypothetical protein
VGRWLRPGHLVQQSVPLGRCTESRSRRRGSRWPRKPSVATRCSGRAIRQPRTRRRRNASEDEEKAVSARVTPAARRAGGDAGAGQGLGRESLCCVRGQGHRRGRAAPSRRSPERVSPRVFRAVALPAPTEREQSQTYLHDTYRTFPPGRGRDLRPQLVQPRRCRTGHGPLSPKTRSPDSCNWSQVSRRPWSTRASCW